jgi:hypothetical protein
MTDIGKVSKIMRDSFRRSADRDNLSFEFGLTEDLDMIFSSTTWGFREILLVVTIARSMDPSYMPSVELYKCYPRSLYDGPIRDVLIEYKIPNRKSGPLNIAKATKGLDDVWAAQKRPKDVADSVVKIVSKIEK